MNRVFFSVVTVLVWLSPHATAQPSFQNLGFESGTLVPIPGRPSDPIQRVEFAPAFPRWSGHTLTGNQTSAWHNSTSLSGGVIALIGDGWPGSGRIQGNYTAVIQAGGAAPGPGVDSWLAQTGVVPLGTESLFFTALPYADPFGIPQRPSFIDTFAVTLGGQPLSLIALGNGPGRSIVFGADVHSWAGQSTELRFTAFGQVEGFNNLFLDSIQFSTVPIPEPSTVGLFILGGLVLGLARWRSRLKR